MKVLMATTAGSGHFGPILPLGAALLRAGHTVEVAAPRSFVAAVERAGYPYRLCEDIPPEEYQAAHERRLANVATLGHAAAAEIFAHLAPRAMFPGVLDAIDSWRPDLVLREVGELSSHLAAVLRGVPQAQVMLGLSAFDDLLLPAIVPYADRLRSETGLPPDPDGSAFAAVPSLSQLPLSYEDPSAPGHPEMRRFRAVSAAPAALPAWWPAADLPLVYVTFGSVAPVVPFASAALRTVVSSLADLPVRLLVTVGDAGSVDGFPAEAHVERWVPQRDVLAAASVMVCHGGMGTVLGGLAAGVPMVVVPQFADQPENASRVAALGAGLRVGDFGMVAEAPPPDPAAVRSAVLRVLEEPPFREAAGRVAAEIHALPTADEMVPELEGLAVRV
ncbi:MAG: glycosyltransferase [Actinophytocola sp.]|uniref:glycosyltransferase n=1 Tax=Actinophytocola sp. TaxID=1872138 RepID=UPI00132334DC|nr:glycosyltransferase [Actinophytocola sp.]MPZ79849.1 glycosyltransferase [Actinophytocola sp.]